MFGLTFRDALLLAATIIIVLLVAVFLWDMRRRGLTPKQEIAALRADPHGTLEQAALKAGDIADTVRDAVVAAIKQGAASLPPATLKDSYFDSDNFLMDLGRLGPDYTKTVRLDERIKRDGSAEIVDYYTQEPSKNVTKNKPAA